MIKGFKGVERACTRLLLDGEIKSAVEMVSQALDSKDYHLLTKDGMVFIGLKEDGKKRIFWGQRISELEEVKGPLTGPSGLSPLPKSIPFGDVSFSGPRLNDLSLMRDGRYPQGQPRLVEAYEAAIARLLQCQEKLREIKELRVDRAIGGEIFKGEAVVSKDALSSIDDCLFDVEFHKEDD